ncbi:MAG TPA: SpoIIE family protein phosphatase [Acidimicrobiales bacterium]|nr:SpoIIE family protein phosphatase [Acidimicrobiales bacterium]
MTGAVPAGPDPESEVGGTLRGAGRTGHDELSNGFDVERVLSVQRAVRALANSADEWWTRLTEAADSVVTAETLDAFYHEAVRAMQEVLGADEVSILLSDHEESALVSRSSVGLGEEGTVTLRIPAGKGMAGQVLATRGPLIVADLDQITLVSPVLREQGLRSVVAVPILLDRRVLGVLHAGSRQRAHFTAADAELLGFLAERLALAVDRVRLFEEQRRLAGVATFLADTARVVANASGFDATLDALAKAALPTLGDLCLIDIVDDDGTLRRVVARHVDPSKRPLVERLRTEFAPEIGGDHPAAEALRSWQTRWSATMSEDFLRATTRDEAHFRLTRELGFRSYVAVPIGVGGELPIGALTMVSCTRALGPTDVALAENLAKQVGAVVANAQQLDKTALTSRLLQEALLPAELPEARGLEVHASYAAASQALDVGGDFYDAMTLPNGNLLVMVGDVEGHDRRAAAVMGQLRSAARTIAIRCEGPSSVIAELRVAWDYLGLSRMATVLCAQVDPADGRVALASAGHPPPLLVGSGGAAFVPVEPSRPLGLSGDAAPIAAIDLVPGQVLVLYTDGALAERAHGVGEGMERLRKVVETASLGPAAICDAILGSVPQLDDDVALLCVSRRP